MAHQRYLIYTNEHIALPCDLDVERPIRLILDDLLAARSEGRSGYALFAGPEHRLLSSEQTLMQARYDAGGDLYLAPSNALWWERIAEASPAPLSQSAPTPRPTGETRRIPFAALGIIGTGICVIVLVLLLLPKQPANPTIAAPQITAAPAVAVKPTVTLVPAVAVPTLPLPTATVMSEPAQVREITPAQLQIAQQPQEILLRGEHLAGITRIALVASGTDRAQIAMAVQEQSENELRIRPVVPFDATMNGVYSILLNDTGVGEVRISDALREATAQGIQPAYSNRNARFFLNGRSGFGAYLWAEPELRSKIPASNGSVVVSNGDVLEVLDEATPGVYRVRVRSNALDSDDPVVIGATGWLARWLIDNQNVPEAPRPTPTPTPKPRPAAFSGGVAGVAIDGAVQCGSAFESSIWGSVQDAGGRGISGAVIEVVGKNGYRMPQATTQRNGTYSIPGLACETWEVRLVSVPNTPNGFAAPRVVVNGLNGGSYSSAQVVFRAK